MQEWVNIIGGVVIFGGGLFGICWIWATVEDALKRR